MKQRWSIANRIQITFLAAIGMLVAIGFLSFYYMGKLNEGLEKIVKEDIRQARLTEEIKSITFDIFRKERQYFASLTDLKSAAELDELIESFLIKIKEAQKFSNKSENIERYSSMVKGVQVYQEDLNELKNYENLSETQINNLKNKLRNQILLVNSINQALLQDRYKELDAHQKQVSQLISEAQRNMILVVLFMLVGALALGFVAPSVVTSPFRKMVQAIGEVRTGKLNISIPVEANDEIGEIAKSLNKMISELREFDEMKIKRIAFEKRRFEMLANMVDYGVMVLKKEGVIEYINSQLFLLLRLESTDIEGLRIEHTPLPSEIKSLLIECLETKQKLDNHEIKVTVIDDEGKKISLELLVDTSLVRTHDGTVVNFIITLEEKSSHRDKEYLVRNVGTKLEEEAS
ncbi:MAG: HAMP domain-containing protein [Deltaproteobacteria bacterium]|nr:HAMP domain-containing protein [Deltaproteobacteria bacterium]